MAGNICLALVRGPNVVPGVPPLSADQCGAVFGLGMIMSRFGPQAGGVLRTSTRPTLCSGSQRTESARLH